MRSTPALWAPTGGLSHLAPAREPLPVQTLTFLREALKSRVPDTSSQPCWPCSVLA